jgi:hypothetical protein
MSYDPEERKSAARAAKAEANMAPAPDMNTELIARMTAETLKAVLASDIILRLMLGIPCESDAERKAMAAFRAIDAKFEGAKKTGSTRVSEGRKYSREETTFHAEKREIESKLRRLDLTGRIDGNIENVLEWE